MAHYDGYLRDNMNNYRYGDVARRDIIAALQRFPDLRPCVEAFTFPNGDTKQLLALGGTVPISHRGNTYNIPVCLYMQPNAPYDGPMVYVRPTPNMEVRVSQNVDASGRIYLPYITTWSYPQSHLLGLLQVLQAHFGESPPVTSRQSPRQPTPPVSSAAAAPYQQQPRPPQQQPQAGYGWGAGYAWSQPPQQPPQQPQYPAYQQPHYPAYQQPQQQQQGTRQDFNEQAIRGSVLAATEDKLRRRYSEKRSQLGAEMEATRRTGNDLAEGKAKLEALVGKLEADAASLQAHVAELRRRNEETEQLLAQRSAQGAPSVDEAVDTTAPLYRQIVRCHAEDHALEDALYALGDALKRGAVGFDDFLKNVRELSRRQFLARATVQVGRQKAGLPEA